MDTGAYAWETVRTNLRAIWVFWMHIWTVLHPNKTLVSCPSPGPYHRDDDYDFWLENFVKGELFSKLRSVPSQEEGKEATRQLQMNFRQNWRYPLECLSDTDYWPCRSVAELKFQCLLSFNCVISSSSLCPLNYWVNWRWRSCMASFNACLSDASPEYTHWGWQQT